MRWGRLVYPARMAGRTPRDIWDRACEEGDRRVARSTKGEAATAFVGGIDVMVGLGITLVVSGALLAITTEDVAHVVGAMFFGIAFVAIAIGRSELFTENFLVPVVAVLARGRSKRELAKIWSISLLFNLLGITLFAALFAVEGVLPESTVEAGAFLGDKFVDRGILDGLASAIIAGTAITVFTWMSIATERDSTRVILGLLIGIVLLVPILNHSVVSFGEVMFAIFSGGTQTSVGEVALSELVAIVGNLLGGLLFVTSSRMLQVSGEPHDEAHARKQKLRSRILLPTRRSNR